LTLANDGMRRHVEDSPMFHAEPRSGMTRFAFKPPGGAEEVYLAGDFTDWQPMAMKKRKDGLFAVDVRLAPGNHEYKFIVDDSWVVDPDNSVWSVNPYGSLNSVASV
jgi:1,4-alpha-glucan branching enzyme